MSRLFTALCVVVGWAAIFFVALCLLPALIPFAPLIAFMFVVWLVYKVLKGA